MLTNENASDLVARAAYRTAAEVDHLPRGDLAAVLHEAIRCGIEKHGKRKGAVRPARKVESRASPDKGPATVSAELRRQVWERDGGRCTWTGPEGRRCKSHNLLYAEQVYGSEVMARYRRGERTAHVDSRREAANEARRTG